MANEKFLYRGNDIVKIWEQHLKSIDQDLKFFNGGGYVVSIFNKMSQQKESAIVVKKDNTLYINKDDLSISLLGEVNYTRQEIKDKIQEAIEQIKGYNTQASVKEEGQKKNHTI